MNNKTLIANLPDLEELQPKDAIAMSFPIMKLLKIEHDKEVADNEERPTKITIKNASITLNNGIIAGGGMSHIKLENTPNSDKPTAKIGSVNDSPLLCKIVD